MEIVVISMTFSTVLAIVVGELIFNRRVKRTKKRLKVLIYEDILVSLAELCQKIREGQKQTTE